MSDVSAYGTNWHNCIREDFWLIVVTEGNEDETETADTADLINALAAKGHAVDVHDAEANVEEALEFFDITLLGDIADCRNYDCVIGAVKHDEYVVFDGDALAALVKPGGLIVDLKGMWRGVTLGIERMEI